LLYNPEQFKAWKNGMEELILLGQIPGTSIHITFSSWLLVALCTGLLLAILYDRRHQQRLFLSAVYLSLRFSKRKMIKQFDVIAL
jgi:hypothetical protein